MTINYLSVREVATRWRVSPMTVYRLLQEGRLEYTRVGRQIRIEEDEAERFIAQNTWASLPEQVVRTAVPR